MKCLPRPSRRRRKRHKAWPFYWSGGPMPSTERGIRRHQHRSEARRTHAEAVWSHGKVFPK